MATKKKKAATNPKPASHFINLREELLLQVDGEEERKHVLNWDILKDIVDNTQKLINKLAKYSLEKESIPLDLLKINFVGFYPGSAVPAIQLAQPPNLLFSTDKYYKTINADFNFIISCVDKGNFQMIADRYKDAVVKNDVVSCVYDFTNSAGTKPLNVVKKIPGKENGFKKLATVRKMSPKVLNLLHVPEPKEIKSIQDAEGISAVGKFILKKSPKGRTQKKDVHLYTQKEAVLSLKFDSIETDKRIYFLSNLLFIDIKKDEKNSCLIENDLLGIYAFGTTLEEAQSDLFNQFDYTYQRLNELPDEKLGVHLLKAKNYINLIVDKVKEK